jgi:hypothetical protein
MIQFHDTVGKYFRQIIGGNSFLKIQENIRYIASSNYNLRYIYIDHAARARYIYIRMYLHK